MTDVPIDATELREQLRARLPDTMEITYWDQTPVRDQHGDHIRMGVGTMFGGRGRYSAAILDTPIAVAAVDEVAKYILEGYRQGG